MSRRYTPRPLVAYPAKAASGRWREERSEARRVRASLLPIRTQEATAAEMSEILGKPVSRQNVEMWEIIAITKILAGLRAEGVSVGAEV